MTRFVYPFVLCLLAASTAQARSQADYNYPLSRVWTSVVRLLRVDMEAPISEKDKDEGYFLFDLPMDGRTYSGSVEVVAVRSKGVPLVRVVVQLAGLPSYVETMVLSKLERKLKKEFGPPKTEAEEPPSAPSPKKKVSSETVDERPPADSEGKAESERQESGNRR